MQKINKKKFLCTKKFSHFSSHIYLFFIRLRVKSLFNLFISSVMQQLPYKNSVFIYKGLSTFAIAATAALVWIIMKNKIKIRELFFSHTIHVDRAMFPFQSVYRKYIFIVRVYISWVSEWERREHEVFQCFHVALLNVSFIVVAFCKIQFFNEIFNFNQILIINFNLLN